MIADPGAETGDVGLCARCRWAREIPNRRGSVFWLCGRSELDRAWPKYPRLPVRMCRGYEEDDRPSPAGAP